MRRVRGGIRNEGEQMSKRGKSLYGLVKTLCQELGSVMDSTLAKRSKRKTRNETEKAGKT